MQVSEIASDFWGPRWASQSQKSQKSLRFWCASVSHFPDHASLPLDCSEERSMMYDLSNRFVPDNGRELQSTHTIWPTGRHIDRAKLKHCKWQHGQVKISRFFCLCWEISARGVSKNMVRNCVLIFHGRLRCFSFARHKAPANTMEELVLQCSGFRGATVEAPRCLKRIRAILFEAWKQPPLNPLTSTLSLHAAHVYTHYLSISTSISAVELKAGPRFAFL